MVIASDYTLMDVLSKSQWMPEADLTQVRITRREKVNNEEKMITKIINFDDYLRVRPGVAPDESQNPSLKDKDRIYVSFKASQGSGVISVGGEIAKPAQNIPLRVSPYMTVREVINLVGGTTPQANRKAISIRRVGLDRPLIIDLDKADQGDLVNNIELKPDDVIYVERLENNAYINLTGGFVKPGKFIYDKRTTLLQALGEGGGPAPFARVHEGKIFRHPDGDPKNTQVIPFNLKKIEQGKAPDIALQPGDTIWISPGGQPRPPITVESAISTITQTVWLYNMISGRFFFGPGVGR
jgi:protein involved in polysaccharide export with SLBB domain